jgi:hypothetical protein
MSEELQAAKDVGEVLPKDALSYAVASLMAIWTMTVRFAMGRELKARDVRDAATDARLTSVEGTVGKIRDDVAYLRGIAEGSKGRGGA